MSTGRGIFFAAFTASIATLAFAAQPPADGNVTVQWEQAQRISNTVPTTQILAHKFTLRSSPMHDPEFRALKNLHTDDTRLQLWFSVTNQAVAELKQPTVTQTFWDFKYMDPLVADFYADTSGKRHINMGTIPRWMFNVPDVELPSDPGASFYAYTDGTRGDLLKDPSGRQFAEYQARLLQWYTKGGFTDELGKYHKSGHHYKIDYWGVLNEPDFENRITVEQYTKLYDAVTEAIHKIDPNVEFFGPEVSGAEIQWEKYFLNPKNHAPNALPVKWFSFHNYVNTNNDPANWQAELFTNPASSETDGASADAFAKRIQEVMRIRDELSPKTKLIVDESGTFDLVKPNEDSCRADEPYHAYNPLYWNATGANWAYNFITAERLGIGMMSVSQMDGYPTQCPSISEMDYETKRPNSHYWVLKLVNDHFGPGAKLVSTNSSTADVQAQASITRAGRKLLLVNTSNHDVTLDLAQSFKSGALHASIVDEKSGEQPPRQEKLTDGHITLAPFAVAVISQ